MANYFRQRTPKDSLIKIGSTTYKKLFLLVRATSKMYQNPYFIYKNKKITIKKFKISKTNFKFKNNIFIKSNRIFLKLKDKVIELI